MTAPRGDAPDRTRAILDERAKRLATPLAAPATAQFAVDAIVFTVNRQRYAVASRYVYATFQLAELVPLPGARLPVVGLTRWRGDVLTVLDLRRLVGLSPQALDDLSRVIVVGDNAPELGLLADAIEELRPIDPTSLYLLGDQTGDTSAGVAPALLAGVTADGIHMIDAAALIARQTESAASAAPAPVSPSTITER